MRGYGNCKFCRGRGCLACEGERERDNERAMNQSFNNPLLVLKDGPNEDPVGWEILKGLHADMVTGYYEMFPGNPGLANAVLELNFLSRKEKILVREQETDQKYLELSIARFESEGGLICTETAR